MRQRKGFGVMALVALGALTACSATSSAGDGAGGAGGSAGDSGIGGNSPGVGGMSSLGGTAGTSSTGGTAGGTTGGAAGHTTGGTGGATAGSGGSKAGSGGSTAGSGGAATGCPTGDPCGAIDANGVCDNGKVKKCVAPPVGTGNEQCPAVIQETSCPTYAGCKVDTDGTAKCMQTTVCVPDESVCDSTDTTVVKTCAHDGSAYTSKTCDAGSECKPNPQTGEAECRVIPMAPTGGAIPTLSGHVTFEKHGYDANADMTDFSESSAHPADAWLQFVAIYNVDSGGNQTYVGSAITGGDGKFTANLSAPADANTIVYVYSLDFAPGSNTPLVAVVRNVDPHIDTQASDDYWFWSNKGANNGPCQMAPAAVTVDGSGNGTMADMFIPESCGSGAINVFQWVRYGMYRLGDQTYGLNATKAKAQETIAVFWEPGIHSDCGACFYNGGGATVTPMGTTTVDHYDTLMQISGDDASPTQWSYSVMSHETGHWVMDNYSKSPGEGGQHFVDAASIAGLSYSEGWATAFGLWNQSNDDPAAPDFDATYIDKQDGTVFWVKVDQAVYSGGALQLPNKADPPGQNINENVVSDMIWHLWQPPAAAKPLDTSTYAGVGPEAVLGFFQSSRLTMGTPRAYMDKNGKPRLCIADFFDAYSCNGGNDANIATSTDPVGYPWGTKSCN